MTSSVIDRVNIESIPLQKLKPWAANPRTISDAARSGLRSSLERFGVVEPIVVNRLGKRLEVVSGHQRLGLLMDSGARRIRCVVLDLPKAEARALALSLNNRAIQGEFTADVAALLSEIKTTLGPEAYAELALEAVKGQAVWREAGGHTAPDDIPEPRRKAITRPGDLWTLGEHRLLCGDSTKPETFEQLMAGDKAGLLSTDPPYLIDYDGTGRPKNRQGKGGGKDWSALYREKEISDPATFLRGFLTACLAFAEPNAAIYIWHSHRRYSLLESICSELGVRLHQQIIWAKPVAALTRSYYAWQHEPCVMGWLEGHKPPLDRREGRAASTVWILGPDKSGDPTAPEYYTDVWPLDWDGKKRPSGVFHPTVKPVEIFARPMRVHTAPGEICLEPFSGSGSQLIAAERLGRRCYAVELEPVFVDVAVRRWEEFTGRKAERRKAG